MPNNLMWLFVFDSVLYSVMNIVRKNVINQVSVANFIITNFLIKSVLMVGVIAYYWKDYNTSANYKFISKNRWSFLFLACVSIITGFIFKTIIKNTDISFSIPFSFVMSNIFITILSIYCLGEKVSVRRMLGLGVCVCGLYLISE